MFDAYELDGLFDEMFVTAQKPRAHYAPVLSRIRELGPDAIQRRRRMADLSFRNQGITFTVYSDQTGVEKIFPFDIVPRIIPASEWAQIGVATRAGMVGRTIGPPAESE